MAWLMAKQLGRMPSPRSDQTRDTFLLLHLHEILSLCRREDEVPQDMRDAKIVTLFKNKGDRSVCNNYRGIFLLSTVGKVFA